MLVCASCQHLGKPYHEDSVVRRPPAGIVRLPRIPARRAAELPKEMEELDIAENFSDLIRKRRMKLALSQEDLAMRVKEKLSVIQKIEMGKMAPNTQLCRQLQHELKIKLLVPRTETPPPKTAAPSEVTLGDIIKIKTKPEHTSPH